MAKNDDLIRTSVFLVSITIGVILTVLLGKELCWDLANYHFYNPYALLNHRSQSDYWPVSYIHQFLNPTLDLLSYFLIIKTSPLVCEAVLGALSGLNIWLLFLIARQFTTTSIALMIAFVGIYGPTALSGFGSFQLDNIISLFVLGFILLFDRNIYLAGFLLGAACGLKLTAGIYVVGAIIACILTQKNKIKVLLLLMGAVLIGLLITSGYWMLLLYKQHHNPIFPFFNHVFHASDFGNINWYDPRFLPHGFWQTIAYPLYFSWDGRIAESPFRDFRFLLLYLFLICLIIQKSQLTRKELWLVLFFTGSYIAWQYFFSIARYMVTLEMLSPLLIYLLIRNLFSSIELRVGVITLCFYIIILFMRPTEMIRMPDYSGTFFNTKLPAVTKKLSEATVLIAYSAFAYTAEPRPQSYLIPFFPDRWRFIGIPISDHAVDLTANDEKRISDLLKNSKHIFLLSSDYSMPSLRQVALRFNLQATGACDRVVSDRQKITNQDVLLCPVDRRSMTNEGIGK